MLTRTIAVVVAVASASACSFPDAKRLHDGLIGQCSLSPPAPECTFAAISEDDLKCCDAGWSNNPDFEPRCESSNYLELTCIDGSAPDAAEKRFWERWAAEEVTTQAAQDCFFALFNDECAGDAEGSELAAIIEGFQRCARVDDVNPLGLRIDDDCLDACDDDLSACGPETCTSGDIDACMDAWVRCRDACPVE